MQIDEYQEKARSTAVYDRSTNKYALAYVALGLAGEAGEVAEKIKKYLRGDGELDEKGLKKELGDVCWYLANICCELSLSLEDVMKSNIDKLNDRKNRGVIKGSGDNR